MTVREMLERMDSRELTEWMAYAEFEPFGEERDDLRAAQICAILANTNRRKGSPPVSPAKFMPQFRPRSHPKRQTMDEMKAKLVEIAEAFKKKPERKKKPPVAITGSQRGKGKR